MSRLVEADLGRLFSPRDVTDGVVHLTIIEDQKRSKVAARQIIFETESYPPILCVPGVQPARAQARDDVVDGMQIRCSGP